MHSPRAFERLVLTALILALSGCREKAASPAPSPSPALRKPVATEKPKPPSIVEEVERFPVRHMPPTDESGADPSDPSFHDFRLELLRAIEQSDEDYIESHLLPEVMVSFGDDNGAKAFMKKFGLGTPGNARRAAEFWREIELLVGFGCARTKWNDRSAFVCPYAYERWPDDLGNEDFVLTIKPETGLYSNRKNSKSKTTLNYEFVKVDPSDNRSGPRLQVTTGRGEKGFVVQKETYSPYDYRIFFVWSHDTWKFATFIAGD